MHQNLRQLRRLVLFTVNDHAANIDVAGANDVEGHSGAVTSSPVVARRGNVNGDVRQSIPQVRDDGLPGAGHIVVSLARSLAGDLITLIAPLANRLLSRCVLLVG